MQSTKTPIRFTVKPIAALITIAVLTLTSVTGAKAQHNTGSLSGRITDRHGATVAGAAARLWQRATGFDRKTTSDATGNFEFDGLTEGAYNLSVSGDGFSSLTREVIIAPAETRSLDFTLEPAAIAAEITVSANRIAETPQTVEHIPGSFDVIDEKTLEASRVFTFTEALRKVAGIQVRDEEGLGLKPNIGIRGLNPTRSTKLLLLEDGIPLTYAPYGDNASYYHPPIDRFESIEVLKGSGQILYGPTTVGGVINYITPNPPLQPAGSVTLIGGNRDYFNGHINYGGTWNGTGLMFSYMRKQGEGSRENVRSGLNDFYFKSLTAIGSRQALTFRANYYSEDSNSTYSGLREDEYRADPRQNPFRNDYFYGDRWGASATHSFVFSNNHALTTNLYGQIFKRHWWRQSSNSSQRPNDALDPDCGGMANLNTNCGNEGRLREYYIWGVEPRLHSTFRLFGANNELDLGIRIHFENQDRRQENGPRPTSRAGVIVESNERKNQAYSSFIQNRFIWGDWSVTPGVRVEYIEYERTNRLANNGSGVTGKSNLAQMVPGLGLAYTPRPSITIFGGLHRGFAPPRTEDVINNTTGGTVELDPELSWNYELGVRALAYPGVRFDLTMFRMDYENQIIPASLAGGIGATLTNGGETRHQGLELTARVDTGTILRTPHNFYLRTAYTYLPDAEFRGLRFSNIPGFSMVGITGNRLPYAPEHLLNFNAGYSNPSGLDALIEAVHVSDQFADDLNTIQPSPDGQRGLIPSYTIWNATVNYSVEAMRSTLFITCKNLLDRTFIVDRSRGILPSSPRLVQAGVKFRF
jgi:Fe(3+) dicitrate transport protein